MPKYKVFAIVVFYKPTKQEFLNLLETNKQVDKSLVVINGCNEIVDDLIKTYFKEIKNIFVIKNAENLGVSVALNQGVKKSQEEKADFVLTLDQDSILTPKMVHDMLEVRERMLFEGINESEIAILQPVLVDKNTQQMKIRNPKPNTNYGEISDCYTSGNLIDTKVYKKVGYYYEPFFVYGTDTEFNLRVQNLGMKIFEITTAKLIHQEGEIKLYKFLGKTFTSTNHSPIARYFLSRNTILIWKKFWLTNPKWFINSVNWYIRSLVKIILFEESKWTKFKMIFIGVYHGFIGKTGNI